MLKQLDPDEIISFYKLELRSAVNETSHRPPNSNPLYVKGWMDAFRDMAFMLNMTRTEDGTFDYDDRFGDPLGNEEER